MLYRKVVQKARLVCLGVGDDALEIGREIVGDLGGGCAKHNISYGPEIRREKKKKDVTKLVTRSRDHLSNVYYEPPQFLKRLLELWQVFVRPYVPVTGLRKLRGKIGGDGGDIDGRVVIVGALQGI